MGIRSDDPEIGAQLEAARELLGMELAYVAQRHGGHEIYRGVAGDGASFGVHRDDFVRIDRSPCPSADATLPMAIEDTGRSDVGSYVCVPVRLSGGRPFGRLCCLSSRPHSPLGRREVRLMEVLAGLVSERIEHQQERDERAAMERETGKRQIEATGVGAFLSALEMRDSYTGQHADAVVDLALEVADAMNLSVEERRQVGQVALLHDIGKIGVPDDVLQKPGPLTGEEWAVMRQHPEHGARMVSSVVGLGHLARAVRAEHERWDGHGYPDGLRGREIPVASRIVFACDAFHAMTSDRPYRPALPREEAVRELRRGRGSQFCPETVEALLRHVGATEDVAAVPA